MSETISTTTFLGSYGDGGPGSSESLKSLLNKERATNDQETLERYKTALLPLRKLFHEFQNSPYRGEWNQNLMNAGQVRDLLNALPPCDQYPRLNLAGIIEREHGG